MAKLNPSAQLDKIVDAIMARSPAASLPTGTKVDSVVRDLSHIAQALYGLPREDFRTHLKTDLERRISMASKPAMTAGVRQSVTPYLAVKGAAEAIEFYKKVFGATETMRLVGPDARIGHAEVRIGNSSIYLSDEYPEYGSIGPQVAGGSPVKINLSVPDVDAVAARAVEAGAKMLRPVQDQFYGERSGQFEDPFGHVWMVSTTIEELSPAEMQDRVNAIMKKDGAAGSPEKPAPAVKPIREGFHTITPYLIVSNAARLIDFLKEGFGAVEKFRVARPGTALIMHAEVKIGDSMLELADANDEFPARLCGIHLYVPDTDALYQRALKAGATSLRTPEDAPYGDRTAAVKDPSGNSWFIATHIKDVKF
jgi:PhnB protein